MRLAPWILLAAAALATSCDDPQPVAEAPPPAPAAPTAPPTPQPTPRPPPIPDGVALLATGGGLVRLEAGVFTALPGSPGGVQRFAPGPDGALWMASSRGVWSMKDGAIKAIPTPPKPGSIDALAVGEDGRVWVAGFQGFAVWDGALWDGHDASALAKGEDIIQDVLVDGPGRVWMLAESGLFVGDIGAWEKQDLGPAAAEELHFDELAGGPDGARYLSHLRGVLQLTEAGWAAIPVDGSLGDGDTLATGPGGMLVSATSGGDVDIRRGNVVSRFESLKAGIAAFDVTALAVDARARLWLVTDQGVVVVDGDQAVQWPVGSVPELKKGVAAVWVTEGGPALPAQVQEVRGKVKGRLLRAGVPIAGATLELCADSSMSFTTSPCEGRSPVSATTGKDGRFQFDSVPFGLQDLLLKEGDSWSQVVGAGCCWRIRDGETLDLEDLNLRGKG